MEWNNPYEPVKFSWETSASSSFIVDDYGLGKDYVGSIANAMELPQLCAEPLMPQC